MSASNYMQLQKIPGETWILAQANPPVKPTPETSTNPNTTNSNGSNNEVSKKNNVDNSPQPSVQHTAETDDNGNTATSTCIWIRDLLKNIKTTTGMNSEKNDDGGSTVRRKNDDSERIRSQRKKLQKKLTSIKQLVRDFEKFHDSAGQRNLDSHLQTLQKLVENEDFEKQEASTSKKTPAVRLAEINKEIMNLMKHLSSPETMSKEISLSAHFQSSTGSNSRSAVHELVNVHQDASFRKGSFYKEIEEIFKGLDDKRKFLLSCFTVFPENAAVKRRIFVYWGVGEELLDASGTKDEMPEKIVDGILKEFQEKGLIEPVIKKRKLHVKSYKMHPLVRSAVTMLSQAGNLFDYDDKGNVLPQRYWSGSKGHLELKVNVSFPTCERMCLLKVEEKDQEQKQKTPSTPKESQLTSNSNSEGTDLETIVTLFNVNEPFPDLELSWLMKKKVKNAEQIKELSAMD